MFASATMLSNKKDSNKTWKKIGDFQFDFQDYEMQFSAEEREASNRLYVGYEIESVGIIKINGKVGDENISVTFINEKNITTTLNFNKNNPEPFINFLNKIDNYSQKGSLGDTLIQDICDTINVKRIDVLQRKIQFFNDLKSLALCADDQIKDLIKNLIKDQANNNNQLKMDSIKFHHSASAIYQGVYFLMENNQLDKLRGIFGDVMDDKKTMKEMCTMLGKFSKEFIAAGTNDSELNNVYNNSKIVDEFFPIRFEPLKDTCSFRGELVMVNAIDETQSIKEGTLVNVIFDIVQKDADRMREIADKPIKKLGLINECLPGTSSVHKRHISLQLRAVFSSKLEQRFNELKEEIAQFVTNFLYAAFVADKILKCPMASDLRTGLSVIQILNKETIMFFVDIRNRLCEVAEHKDNNLPSLHITHGISPIKPCSLNKLEKLLVHVPEIHEIFNQYGFNLKAALCLKKENKQTPYLHLPSLSILATPKIEQPQQSNAQLFQGNLSPEISLS